MYVVQRLGDVSLPACKQGPIVLVYRGWASYVVCVERERETTLLSFQQLKRERERKEMEGIENGKPEVKRLPACIRRGCIGLKTHYGVTAVCSSIEEQHDWKHHQEEPACLLERGVNSRESNWITAYTSRS